MTTLAEVTKKSDSVINRLENEAVKYLASELVKRCYNRGVGIRITHGLRTYAEQQELYNQGRTAASKAKGEKIVTNALPGYSYHNFSLAIDFVLLKGLYDMKYDGDSDGLADWVEVVTEAKKLGFEWGGDWSSFKDYPHFQMTFGLTTAQLRNGSRPTSAQIAQAIDKAKKQEETLMSQDTVNALEEKVKDMETKYAEFTKANEARLKTIEKKINISGNQTPPAWAEETLVVAKKAGAITTSNDKAHSDFVQLQVLRNLGLMGEGFLSLVKEANSVVKDEK